MDSLSPQVVSATKLLILNPNEFDLRKMRIEQYFLMTDYSLWEVILNGDSHVPTRVVKGVLQPVAPITVEQKLARKNELKARGTLLMALPDKHQLKFNSQKDAKTLMEAIEKRFGGNTKTKKVYKTLLNATESVSAAANVSAVCAKMLVSSFPNVDSLSNAIDVDDLEEMDLRWQMAMLTMRARRFLQKTGKNLRANGPTSMGFDMSKVECYNCHEKGHFAQAQECRSPKDSRRNGAVEPQRRTVPVETFTSNALVSQCDGVGSYDWSYQAEEEPANFALMAFSSSSSSNNEVPSCSKACSKAYAQLHTQYDKLTTDVSKSTLMLSHIKQLRDSALVTIRQKLEKAEQERDDLKLKLEKFQTSFKNLTELLAKSDCESWPPSSLYDRFQPSDGYHVVPPPYTGTFMPLKPDLVFNTAPTAVETDHHAFTAPQSVPSFVQSFEQVKSPRNYVQPFETSIPAATPKPASLKSASSSKKRNRKACFVCKSVDHLIKDCDYHANKMAQPTPSNHAHRGNHKYYAPLTHTNPQKHMVPTVMLTQSKLVSIIAVRLVSAVVPKIKVTQPRHVLPIVTKSNSPIRRHITRSPSPKTSNSPPIVTAVKALVVSVGQGNMSYLSDFEELIGGYVAFGGNPKGAEILRKFGLTEGKSASTPIDTEKPLLKDPDGEDVDVHTYSDSPLLRVNTPRSDEDRLELMELIVFLLPKVEKVGIGVNAADLQVNDVTRLQALVDKKNVVVTEATFREALRLDDAEVEVPYPHHLAVHECQKNFMEEFSSSMASAIICLSTGDLSTHTTKYTSPALTHKVFANMRRVRKGIFGVETPLFKGMLVEHEVDEEGDVDEHVEEVNAGDAAQGDDSAAHGEVPTVTEKLSIPFPTPPTPPSQPPQDIPSTSQGEETGEEEQGESVEAKKDDVIVLKKDKEEDAKEDETEPAEVQEVVDVVTTAKLIIEVVTAASETVTVASAIVTTAEAQVPATTLTAALVRIAAALSRRRKGVEPKPLKKKQQIELDEQYARELHAELNKDIDWDEAIDHVKRKAKEEPAVIRYQVLNRKPQTEAQARKNMIMYLKNVAGFKIDYFKGMSYDDIRPIFEAKFNSNMAFLLKTKKQMEEEENRALQKLNETLAERAAKRRRLDKEVEEPRRHLQIVPNEDDDVYTEATPLARKVPVVDYQVIEMNNKPYYKIIRADDTHQLYVSFLSLLRNFDRKDLEALWSLVKERFSTKKPKNFSDDFLLVTLGEMFEKPDIHAQIWKTQRNEHGPAKVKGWKLLESCGVQIITFTSTQLILLVKRRYPLTRFTLDQMLNAIRLKVEEESEYETRTSYNLIYDGFRISQYETRALKKRTEVVTAISETVTVASTIITTAEAQVPTATLTTAPARVTAAPSRRRKRVVIRYPESESTTSTIIPAETKSKDKGKGILVEEPKPLKKKQQIELDEQYARELHAEVNKDIDWDEAIDHVKRKAKEDPAIEDDPAGFKMDYFKGMSYDNIRPIFKTKFNSNVAFLLKIKEQIEEDKNRALQKINETPAEKAAKRRKLDEEVEELRRHLQIVPNEDDDVYTEATPLAQKVLVVDYQVIEINKKPYYRIIKADDTHQLYVSFLNLLRNFDREDLEALWSLVKERFSTTKPKNFSDDFLLVALGAIFEKPDIHAQI
nr:hypothetical protein [Tanacetum cinerariifolium]